MSSAKRIKVAHEEGDIKHIKDLPNDVFQHCLEFVGKGSFAFVAPVSKHFYWNYINLGVEVKNNVIDVDVILQQGRNKKTTVKDVATGSLRLATECFLKAPKEFQVEVCRQAAVNGRLDILKCADAFGIDMKESAFPPYDDNDGNTQSYEITVQLVIKIVANGHLGVIEFLHEQGVELDNEDIIVVIGYRWKARILHWMVSKGIISFWKDEAFNCLLRDGELDILQDSYEDEFPDINKFTFNICAGGGSLAVMNWLLQQYEDVCEWSSILFSRAAASGSIPMMELCLQKGCPPREIICAAAMENKNTEAALNALKWLRKQNIPWNEDVCKKAALYGNLKALKWARENGCPWDSETYNSAAQYGSIEILDYCFQNNCPMDRDSIYDYPFEDERFDPSLSELKARSLKVFKWLHQHSIPWDDGASRIAAREGHLETLMLAVENGCPWHEGILGYSIDQFDFPFVEYCIQHLSPMDGSVYVLAIDKMKENHERRMDADSDAKMIKMLQMFHDYGVPWCRDIIPHAERIGRSNVAKWLRCVGCPE